MSARTALEIASRLEALIPIAGGLAVEALRKQHAEIERLTSINAALTAKSNAFVIENARQAEEIDRLTAERDCAIGMLVDWVVAIRDSDASWDSWDDQYKDAWYRPCLIRDLIDAKLPPEEEDNG